MFGTIIKLKNINTRLPRPIRYKRQHNEIDLNLKTETDFLNGPNASSPETVKVGSVNKL